MARWYRGGRYYGRYKYYKRKYKSMKGKSYGNMKAAKQQADQSTFTINVPSRISCCNHTIGENKQVGVVALNIFDYLRRSAFYSAYAGMYDEFKIDRVKVKLLPTSFTISTGEDYKNLTVYTAWDRSGISPDQCILNTEHVKSGDAKLGDGSNDDGIQLIIGDDITTYSSAESRTLNPNTNTSIVRWLNPKTLQEKSQWISTGSLKKWYDTFDPEKGLYYGLPLNDFYDDQIGLLTSFAANGGIESAGNVAFKISPATSDNPCFILEDNGIRFKPTLLVGVYPSLKKYGEDVDGGDNTVSFNIEIECVCTFRGLRKAAVVA